jgi:hypothetical protein
MTAFLWLAFTSSFWFLKCLFLAGWFVARWATWLLWPVGMLVAGLGALCGLGCRQANAGWFSWLGTDTTKLEAANRAVHAAAEGLNE